MTYAEQATVLFPTVTSALAFIEIAVDTTSANFARLQNDVGSGALTFALADGNKAFTLGEHIISAFYVRAVTSVAQTDNRTLTWMMRT